MTRTTQSPTAARLPRWRWFIAWALVGSAGTLGVLTPFTVGPYLLVATALAGLALLRVRAARSPAVLGLTAGLGVPALWIAWLNGPGHAFDDPWNPWPWLVAGLLLTGAGCLAFHLARNASRARGTVHAPRP